MGKSSIRIGKREVTVSNLDKILYPGGKFTKAQVIEYYVKVGPFLLPHFKNRPVTLVRFPEGVLGHSFYEKDAPGFTPDWIKRFPVRRSEGGFINYILINDLATLAWVANLAALELHPFLHRAPHIERPTHMVFDLDPGEGANILTCIEVAFLVRAALDEVALKCFPKVSGSKGLQIYVPLNRQTSYEATNRFSRSLAERLAGEHPKLVVAQMAKILRKGKVFIDWSQNTQSKTTVGVYSLRAKKERPCVSMPVTWKELEKASRDKRPICFSLNRENPWKDWISWAIFSRLFSNSSSSYPEAFPALETRPCVTNADGKSSRQTLALRHTAFDRRKPPP